MNFQCCCFPVTYLVPWLVFPGQSISSFFFFSLLFLLEWGWCLSLALLNFTTISQTQIRGKKKKKNINQQFSSKPKPRHHTSQSLRDLSLYKLKRRERKKKVDLCVYSVLVYCRSHPLGHLLLHLSLRVDFLCIELSWSTCLSVHMFQILKKYVISNHKRIIHMFYIFKLLFPLVGDK